MSRRPSRPKRGGTRPRQSNSRNAFPSDFDSDDGSVDEVDPMPAGDDRTTWVPSEHLDPGEVTSWISGQSDTPDLPDFERTEAKGPRRDVGIEAERTSSIRTPRRRAMDEEAARDRSRKRPEAPRPGRSQAPIASPVSRGKSSKPIAEAPKRTRKRRDSQPPEARSAPEPRATKPSGRRKRIPTPEPAPRRQSAGPLDVNEPTVRADENSRIPTTRPSAGAKPVPKPVPAAPKPRPAPPRRSTSRADDEPSLTVPRPPPVAPPVPQPRPGASQTPMPAPPRQDTLPRAGRMIPPAPRVPRPHEPLPVSSLPGQVVAEAPIGGGPISSVPPAHDPMQSVDEVVPSLPTLPNDAPTVVRPDLAMHAMPPLEASPSSSQPPEPHAFGTSFADEPDGGEPTVALPPPNKRDRSHMSLPPDASYSPPPSAPPPRRGTPAPAERSVAPQQAPQASRSPAPAPQLPQASSPPAPAMQQAQASVPPAQAPQLSRPPEPAPDPPARSGLPKGATVYQDDDDEGLNPLHLIYGGIGLIGIFLIGGAVILGLLALLFV